MKIITFWVILYMIFTGCSAPAPLIKLTPSTLEHGNYWNVNKQFVYTNDKNIWFDCAFNRVENGKLVFDVKVNNQSDSAILVEPAMFQQLAYKNDSLKLGESFAYNPEVTLTFYSMSESRARTGAKNAAVLGILSTILSAGATVAVATSKKDEETKQQLFTVISATNEVVQTTATIVGERANRRAESNWTAYNSLSEKFLRKTILQKGYYIDGEVHFPYFNSAKWYDIVLVSGNAKADFLFRQKLVYP